MPPAARLDAGQDFGAEAEYQRDTPGAAPRDKINGDVDQIGLVGEPRKGWIRLESVGR